MECAQKMKQGNQEVKRMLVTFDIDGTLMQRSGSKFDHLHQAFSHALFEVFGIHGTIDVIQVLHSGSNFRFDIV